MSMLDWAVLAFTILGISVWGVWLTRKQTGEVWLRGTGQQTWPTIGLAVMATQASAITFLSVPGQAFDDGMRFIQFYLGMPLAMIVVSAFFVPRFKAAGVTTAYEYLERRYDGRLRTLGALLFLLQRGLQAGITIYAPAIILSSILDWSLEWTCVLMGLVVVVYTVAGGNEAVSQTQKQQMVVILLGMIVAGVWLALQLPPNMSMGEVAELAGMTGRMQLIDTDFDPRSRYNLWSGLMGGFFLSLSYFGTDQSQVQRYLSGKSVTEIRLGLLFNGVLKIPMQLGILFVGILLFVFHLSVPAPLHFNPALDRQMTESSASADWQSLQQEYAQAQSGRAMMVTEWLDAQDAPGPAVPEAESERREQFLASQAAVEAVRDRAIELAKTTLPDAETKDSDYVFIHYVLHYLPHGLVGLLIAVILLAAMSSTAGELAALGTTTTNDLVARARRTPLTDRQSLWWSRGMTVLWGGVSLSFALFASLLDNLIEAINILGSVFYGPLLGVFLCAFSLTRTRGTDVLVGAAAGQALVLALYFTSDLGFLWYNVVGCLTTLAVAWLMTATGMTRDRA